MEKRAREGATRSTIKKRHLTIAGLITVLLQYGVGKQTESSTAFTLSEMFKAQIAAQKAELEKDQERNFVRKEEMNQILGRIDEKLDSVDGRLEAVQQKVSKVEGYLKAKNHNYGSVLLEDGQEVTKR